MRGNRIRQLLFLLVLVVVAYTAFQIWQGEKSAPDNAPPGQATMTKPAMVPAPAVAPAPMQAATPAATPAAMPTAIPAMRGDAAADMHVYFFYPDKSERYMGTTRGAEGCRRVAGNFAAALKLADDSPWSYGCCDKPDAPECRKKLR